MAPKKKTATDDTVTLLDTPQRVAVVRKSAAEWMGLIRQAEKEHWRKIRVVIQLRDRLLAGKPHDLKAAEAMIRARGLEDVLEARLEEVTDPVEREKLAKEAESSGLCTFHRRDAEGKSGIWFPTNHIKACLKEGWSVLGLRKAHLGSRGALQEGVFVFAATDDPTTPSIERDWIYLGEKPFDIYMGVSHTTGPTGSNSSIKRHEYVVKPTITFDIFIANAIATKLPDNGLAKVFVHQQEHGLGASRSQGFGRFDVLSVEDLGLEDARPETAEERKSA